MGGAFQKKLMGQNGLLSGYSAILRYTNKNLCAEMSAKVTVTHSEGQIFSSQKPVNLTKVGVSVAPPSV